MTEEGAAVSGAVPVVEETLLRRAESLAQEAADEESDDRTALLLFRLGEEWYSIKVDDVREIDKDYVVTPIPCVPSFVRGVVNIRGEIISVTDVAALMHLRIATDIAEAPAIVIQSTECATAMIVDEIGDIVEIPVDGVEPPLSTMGKAQSEFVAGSVCLDGKLVGLLNADRILQPIDTKGS